MEIKKLNWGIFIVFWVAVSVGGCSVESAMAEPPLAAALIRNKILDVEKEFRIKEDRLYAVSLSFRCTERNKIECDRVRELAVGVDRGANANSYGKPLLLRVSIFKKSLNEVVSVLEQSFDSERIELSSWGWGEFDKELIALQLEPGEYMLSVHVVKIDPAINNVNADIKLIKPYRGK